MNNIKYKNFLVAVIAMLFFILPVFCIANETDSENIINDAKIETVENIETITESNPTEQQEVRKESSINFMPYMINFMIEKGVPLNTIYMILILPIIATLVAIARQIIGIESFGIHTPAIITLAFLTIGLKYGLIIFSIIVLTGTITRILARKLRLLYIPRMAILLTVVSISVMVTYFFGIYFGDINLSNISVLPVLLLIVLTENFIAAQMERGYKESIRLTVETLVLSIACFLLVSWNVFMDFILKYPEIIFLTLLINIILGRWTGLRLFEYVRFRQIINQADTEE